LKSCKYGLECEKSRWHCWFCKSEQVAVEAVGYQPRCPNCQSYIVYVSAETGAERCLVCNWKRDGVVR